MKVEVKDLSSVRKQMTVTVPKEEVQKNREDLYREVSREVAIKGFRKGKAPKSVIDTYFGGYIKSELAKKIVEENYDKAVAENGLFVVSMPDIKNDEPKEDEDFTFTAEFDIKPVINPEKFTGFELTEPVFDVTDEDVDSAMASLRDSYSTMEDVTDENHDILKGDYAVSDISSADHERLNWTKVTVDAGNRSFVPGAHEAVVGMKTGEEKEYEALIPEEYYIEELRSKTVKFKIKILSVKHRILPELDDDFAKKVREDTPSLDSLKTKIKEELVKRATDKKMNVMNSKVAELLLEANSFEVPESMIKLQAAMMVQGMAKRFAAQGAKLQDVYPDPSVLQEESLASSEKMLKQALLIEAIAKLTDLKVEDSEVDNEVQEMANTYNMPYEEVKKGLEENGRIDEIRFQLLEEKVFEYIIKNSTVTQETINP
jgi:trigger factor